MCGAPARAHRLCVCLLVCRRLTHARDPRVGVGAEVRVPRCKLDRGCVHVCPQKALIFAPTCCMGREARPAMEHDHRQCGVVCTMQCACVGGGRVALCVCVQGHVLFMSSSDISMEVLLRNNSSTVRFENRLNVASNSASCTTVRWWELHVVSALAPRAEI